jgi:hypothetical protein
MKPDQINYLNIGLMIVSAVAAFYVPFELFLFSYAFLGPLHYLTEISWLHERGYFTRRKQDYLLLALIAVALLGIALFAKFALPSAPPANAAEAAQRNALGQALLQGGNVLIFVAFAGALVMITLKETLYRFFAFVGIVITAIFMRGYETSTVLFSIFLPTIVHVFLFTGAFVLYGALKSRSKSGLLSLIVFIVCPAVLWWLTDAGAGRGISAYAETTYRSTGLDALNKKIIEILHLGPADSLPQIFYSSYGLLVMRIIAYAYTYHYLNWFSKTSVIKWHEVSKVRLAVIVFFWLVSVGLYVYNYQVGLLALYCLSFMHVFLEFPLNHITFLGIGKEISAWWKQWTAPENGQTVLENRL